MSTLLEVLAPDFLLRNSVYLSLLVGAVCPLVGTYLLLRRMVFLGLALPQVSSCGIALAFALHTWGIIPHLEGGEQGLALVGSISVTLLALALVTFGERRGRHLAEGHIGALYILGGAWSILLLVKNPHGEHGLLERLRGDIIAVSNADLAATAAVFAAVTLALLLFRKELLLVSFDREMARTLRKNMLVWDGLLFLIVGLTISMSVLSVGPLVTFGFLLLPPLIAHRLALTMHHFAVGASLIGGLAAFAGFCLAYRWDLPAGPTDLALLGCLYALASIIGRLRARRPKPPQPCSTG